MVGTVITDLMMNVALELLLASAALVTHTVIHGIMHMTVGVRMQMVVLFNQVVNATIT
jgi:hypothetical protein